MMDDNKSKNYNSTIISLTSELIYENDNNEMSRNECYKYITSELNIALDKEYFFKLLESSSNFGFIPGPDDVGIKITSEKFSQIDEKVRRHSIEHYIYEFVTKNGFEVGLCESISNLLNYSIYENINSFSIKNINSLLPIDADKKFTLIEIDTFNKFLDDPEKDKNLELFNVFLKAIEFAILTSGRGVKEFTEDLFIGKEYLLDANIIFRLLGVGGAERQSSLIALIKACIHQGIRFLCSNETYLEVRRKISSSITEINAATQNKSIDIL